MMHVGDVIPLAGSVADRRLCLDGVQRWHALIVRPQREGATVAWLRQNGAYAFYPVRRRCRVTRGRSVTIQSRYLPGYVFARFSGPVIWHRVITGLFVSDAIRLDSGHPAVLHPGDLSALHAMRAVDEAQEAVEQDRLAAARRICAFGRGDRVRIVGGPMEGLAVQVRELRAGSALCRLRLFGSDRDVDIDTALLRLVQPASDAGAPTKGAVA